MTSLYRHYDEFGKLLYIGIAGNIVRRLSQHEKFSAWWNEVVRVDVEHFKTRDAAALAERNAIQTEQPRHNIVDNRDERPPGFGRFIERVKEAPRRMDENAAAEYLGVAVRTLQNWRHRGGGPPFLKIGRSVRYQTSDLNDFIKNARRQNTSQAARGIKKLDQPPVDL